MRVLSFGAYPSRPVVLPKSKSQAKFSGFDTEKSTDEFFVVINPPKETPKTTTPPPKK